MGSVPTTERTRQHNPIEAIQVGSRAHFMRLSAELLQDRAVLLKSALQREHADPLFRVLLHRVRRQRRQRRVVGARKLV